MARQALFKIRTAISHGMYDMTQHASEEMAEDKLNIVDVETSIRNGRLRRSEKDDPRGTRYTVYGTGAIEKLQLAPSADLPKQAVILLSPCTRSRRGSA